MTLTRPAYLVRVEALDGGWTLVTHHGETPDPAADVLLADGLTHLWGFTDDRVPGPFEPATLELALTVRSRDVVPRVREGDAIRVTVSRPLAGWPANPAAASDYFRFEGRLAQPVMALNPHSSRPVTLRLTAVDLLADLNARKSVDDELRMKAVSTLYDAAVAVAETCRVWVDTPAMWELDTESDVWVGDPGLMADLDAHELLASAAATRPVEYTPGEFVVAYPRGYYITTDEVRTPAFRVQPILRRLPFASTIDGLTWPAGGKVTRLQNPAGVPVRADLAHLHARYVRTPLEARISRENAVDTIIAEGWRYLRTEVVDEWEAIERMVYEETTRSRSRRSSSMFGRVTRTLKTWAAFVVGNGTRHDAERIAAAFLPDGSADDLWGCDELDVIASEMSDAELDRYASHFWPPMPTSSSDYPRVLRQVVVDGIDEATAGPSGRLAGIVVGATHTIAGGELTIRPRLVGGILPAHPDATDQLTASQLTAAGGWRASFTALDIDPTLTAADFRLIGNY